MAFLAILAACSSTPKPRPLAPPPQLSRTPLPTFPVIPPKPATAAEAGVAPGPAIETLGLTAEGARLAMAAFRLSCPVLVKRNDVSGLTRPSDWQAACDDAMTRLEGDGPAFFARWFETAVIAGGASFATGYYEPEIAGSRTPVDGYDTPVYRRPPDLIDAEYTADPGGPSGRRRGRMQDGAIIPYYDRAEIDNGALAGKGLEIAWARDPIEFFFLQIQGSGRLLLPDGSVMRIGYDGQNGRDYVAIGRMMRDQGLVVPGQLSMQGIMSALRAQPDGGRAIMEADKSYVFFRELIGPGPIGAMGVAVVGRASVAADPKFVPLGAPIFLSMDRPEASGLWVAQDTGGAIKGANRVDTFWGAGAQARVTAGGMSARGRALLLLPKGSVARWKAGGGLAPRS
jgi:membrane-bound lytic murein transglycosylase A